MASTSEPPLPRLLLLPFDVVVPCSTPLMALKCDAAVDVEWAAELKCDTVATPADGGTVGDIWLVLGTPSELLFGEDRPETAAAAAAAAPLNANRSRCCF